MIRDLVIVGAGGFARETAAAVRTLGDRWRLLGFLDDDPALHGRQRSGVPIIGGSGAIHEMPAAAVVVCVGHPADYAARSRVVRRLALPPDRYATVIHPSAQIGTGSLVGPGSVLLAGVVLTVDVRVGSHVAVMPQAVLTHDNVVADQATIATGVRLGGGVHVDRGAYLGAGALIRQDRRVGAWSLVGMGAVVLDDVPAGQVWVGNPARYLRDSVCTDQHQEVAPR